MPDIQIPNSVIVGIQVILAFAGAFILAIWVSMIIWTFRDVRSRSRDVFAIVLATLMVVIFGPLGLLLYFLLRPPDTLAELYERSLEEEALLQDLEERMVCPGCRRKIEPEWQVCPDCHTILKKQCLNCGELLQLRWNICPYCVAPAMDEPQDGHVHREPVAVVMPEPLEDMFIEETVEAADAAGLYAASELDEGLTLEDDQLEPWYSPQYAESTESQEIGADQEGLEEAEDLLESSWEDLETADFAESDAVSDEVDDSTAAVYAEAEEFADAVDAAESEAEAESVAIDDVVEAVETPDGLDEDLLSESFDGPRKLADADVISAESADTLTDLKLPPNPET